MDATWFDGRALLLVLALIVLVVWSMVMGADARAERHAYREQQRHLRATTCLECGHACWRRDSEGKMFVVEPCQHQRNRAVRVAQLRRNNHEW